jgi:hypothetical protein
MTKRYVFLLSAAIVATSIWSAGPAMAVDLMFGCCGRPACGKICQLKCETKKLTSTCYGCECKDICLPGPSQRGCKHCMKCCGECEDGGPGCCSTCNNCGACGCCPSCQSEPPKCKFCWYDWFACGCAAPRTVKVLTKYEAKHEICWYHWEVVDAACCDGCEEPLAEPVKEKATSNQEQFERPAYPRPPRSISSIEAASRRRVEQPESLLGSGGSKVTMRPKSPQVFKPAPEGVQIGDTIELTEEEQTKLADWMDSQVQDLEPAGGYAPKPAPIATPTEPKAQFNGGTVQTSARQEILEAHADAEAASNDAGFMSSVGHRFADFFRLGPDALVDEPSERTIEFQKSAE